MQWHTLSLPLFSWHLQDQAGLMTCALTPRPSDQLAMPRQLSTQSQQRTALHATSYNPFGVL